MNGHTVSGHRGAALREALDRLYRRRRFGIKLGLDVMRALLARLGNPERDIACVHVAGTNGKGSVCAMLEAVLRAGGARAGLYTSPHLVRFNERVRIDGAELDDAELEACLAEALRASDEVAASGMQEPTFFEVGTALAFLAFRRRRANLAVVETGMGGRLDATNVITPLVSVITRISLEHTAYLGPDLPSIAAEKAGIIKAGRPVVAGAMPDEARDVVAAAARRLGSRLVDAAACVSIRVVRAGLEGQRVQAATESMDYGALDLPLAGAHQVENLATALAALDVLRDDCGIPVDARHVRAGLKQVNWPGRLQVLGESPLIVCDGAHNPGAGQALAAALRKAARGRRIGLVAGMCGDKDAESFLAAFGPQVKRFWIVPVPDERNMPVERLLACGRRLGWECVESTLAPAVESATAWASETGGAVCVTGSLYLVGELLALRRAAAGVDAGRPDGQGH